MHWGGDSCHDRPDIFPTFLRALDYETHHVYMHVLQRDLVLALAKIKQPQKNSYEQDIMGTKTERILLKSSQFPSAQTVTICWVTGSQSCLCHCRDTTVS